MIEKEVEIYLKRRLLDIENARADSLDMVYGEAKGAISMANRLGAISLEEWADYTFEAQRRYYNHPSK